MRYLAIFMAMFLVLAMQAPEAFAKKRFGGGSFGKQYKTAPKQPSSAQSQQRKQQDASKQQRSSKRGMMGGLLGGLLAGGLLASLFAGGAFEGLQMGDILIIAAIAFAIVWFLRRRRRQPQAQAGPFSAFEREPAAAASASGQQRQAQQPFGQQSGTSNHGFSSTAEQAAEEIPFNVPQGFDVEAFLEGARGHYNVLQKAWNENNLKMVQEYVSAELYQSLVSERKSLGDDPQTQVLYVNAELVRADQVFGEACLSVKYTGRCRELSDGSEEAINDVWHLERKLSDPSAPWIIVGISNE
ncbi:putative lipid-binding transport protein (Tim44 family) [Sinobacterium caligoides]|uniref:Putative lipid-binding transport protein (Tim44 family) n=1 Tax=Sinobacterium caligoides TaxID=933926 RepID=A0A3N2DQ84_9GAMM|nr:Tim44-like domain-containing protein [Sinobacterium caligoides]ROS01978.1 putative lipid-binding transport protein (Tim44 family) [Sinobacterium caligoides]